MIKTSNYLQALDIIFNNKITNLSIKIRKPQPNNYEIMGLRNQNKPRAYVFNTKVNFPINYDTTHYAKESKNITSAKNLKTTILNKVDAFKKHKSIQ